MSHPSVIHLMGGRLLLCPPNPGFALPQWAWVFLSQCFSALVGAAPSIPVDSKPRVYTTASISPTSRVEGSGKLDQGRAWAPLLVPAESFGTRNEGKGSGHRENQIGGTSTGNIFPVLDPSHLTKPLLQGHTNTSHNSSGFQIVSPQLILFWIKTLGRSPVLLQNGPGTKSSADYSRCCWGFRLEHSRWFQMVPRFSDQNSSPAEIAEVLGSGLQLVGNKVDAALFTTLWGQHPVRTGVYCFGSWTERHFNAVNFMAWSNENIRRYRRCSPRGWLTLRPLMTSGLFCVLITVPFRAWDRQTTNPRSLPLCTPKAPCLTLFLGIFWGQSTQGSCQRL